MRVFREAEDPEIGRNAVTFALGALGGFAIGLALSGRRQQARAHTRSELGNQLRERARSVARRLGPGRLRRAAPEQTELTALEDAVLDALLADPVLSERAIDVGAVSRGVIELSGSIGSAAEAEEAVRVASRVPGVQTVINRLAVREGIRGISTAGLGVDEEDADFGGFSTTGRRVGMGRRRQGLQTDPDRPDDSQQQLEEAIRDADRDQWVDEGFAAKNPRVTVSENPVAENRTNYRESELDNQDPHGKHAARTLDAQPQVLNTDARVGEGVEPGIELALESADLPVKPHGRGGGAGGEDGAVE